MKRVHSLLLILASVLLIQNVATAAETIAVIGTGNVGAALGPRWAALGHHVIYGSRAPDSDKVKALVKESPGAGAASPQAAAAKADIVVLAIPSGAAKETIAGLGDLKGKIIIDAMNILTFKDGHVIDPDSRESLLSQVQAWAPGAAVVKAFNTTNAGVMRNPAITGGPVTIPIAGDDAAAKARVTALTTALGFDVIDLGGHEAALFAEQLGRLYVGYSATHRPKRLEFNLRVWGN